MSELGHKIGTATKDVLRTGIIHYQDSLRGQGYEPSSSNEVLHALQLPGLRPAVLAYIRICAERADRQMDEIEHSLRPVPDGVKPLMKHTLTGAFAVSAPLEAGIVMAGGAKRLNRALASTPVVDWVGSSTSESNDDSGVNQADLEYYKSLPRALEDEHRKAARAQLDRYVESGDMTGQEADDLMKKWDKRHGY